MRFTLPGRGLRALAAAVCAAATSLAGCAASPQGAPRGATAGDTPASIAAQMRNDLAIEVADAPNFYADTARRRVFGIVGVVAMAIEGNRIIRDLAIPDPAIAMAETLRERLQGRQAGNAAPINAGLRLVANPAPANERSTTRDLGESSSSRPQGAGPWRLKVRTVNWDFRPFRNDDTQLVIVYAARIDLEHAASGELVASERCEKRRSPAGDVTVSRLLADGGKVLREELAAAGRACLDALNDGSMSASLGTRTSIAQR